MGEYNPGAAMPGHWCPSPDCAARGHQPANPFPNAIPTFPTFPSPMQPATPVAPIIPSATGMFWTHEQLAALLNAVRKDERATVLSELEILKQIPATED